MVLLISLIEFLIHSLLDRFETDAQRNLEDESAIYGYNGTHVYRTSHNPDYVDTSLSNDSVCSLDGDGYSKKPISPVQFDRGEGWYYALDIIELRPMLPAVTPLALLALWLAFPAVTPHIIMTPLRTMACVAR